ncbi:hypothetical protein EGT07_07795 [Herbaspirillum sp. HC18]|nr:hypothetical protein EGT07_07795 [Herbaspirillum sp. HC18]
MKVVMSRCIAIALFALMSNAAVLAQEVKVSLAGGEAGRIYFNSANRDTGISLLYRGKAKYEDLIFGDLAIPNGASTMPAMVIMHGSGGVDGGTSRAWATFFNSMGIATFIVNSFTQRGILGTGTEQEQLTYTASGVDGLKALQLLATHPRIDPKRIGIIGFSRGGVAVQETSLEKFRAAVIADNLKFALHIALYGGCSQYGSTTGSPVLHMVGEDDGYLSVEQCKKTTEMTNAKGGKVRLLSFPGALHGFDSDSVRRSYMANFQTWKNCRYETDMDTLVTQIPGNANASVNELVEYRKTCMTRGVTYGGDYSATSKARQEVKAMVSSIFGL